MASIILFDGICNLCNSSIQFIIKRDSNEKYMFASLQSKTGQQMLRLHGLPEDTNSFVLIEDAKCYIQSTAALRICKHLNGGWRLFAIFTIVPKPIRDFCYNLVARNRYKWFGKEEICLVPSAHIRSRFLD